MSSLHLIDPTLRPALAALPPLVLDRDSLPDLRNRPAISSFADDGLATCDVHLVPRGAGAVEVPLHLFRPAGVGDILPCIYHMHGGGYVLANVADNDRQLRQLAAELRCVVASVEYRLAPETLYPGPIEDCYAGLAWLYAHAAAIDIDTGRLGVMGHSAGGGYAAALTLMARDRREYSLAFQHLTYPMLDDRTGTGTGTGTGTPHPYAGEFVWTADHSRFGWHALLGHEPGIGDVPSYAALGRGDDLANLPPAYIATGALALFVDENTDYAKWLIRAGVPVELHVYPWACHGFDAVPDSPLSARARADGRDNLRRALG